MILKELEQTPLRSKLNQVDTVHTVDTFTLNWSLGPIFITFTKTFLLYIRIFWILFALNDPDQPFHYAESTKRNRLRRRHSFYGSECHKTVMQFILRADLPLLIKCVEEASTLRDCTCLKQPRITFTVNKQGQIFIFWEQHSTRLDIFGLVSFFSAVGFNECGWWGLSEMLLFARCIPHRLVKTLTVRSDCSDNNAPLSPGM